MGPYAETNQKCVAYSICIFDIYHFYFVDIKKTRNKQIDKTKIMIAVTPSTPLPNMMVTNVSVTEGKETCKSVYVICICSMLF